MESIEIKEIKLVAIGDGAVGSTNKHQFMTHDLLFIYLFYLLYRDVLASNLFR
jgi:hypothetical protein